MGNHPLKNPAMPSVLTSFNTSCTIDPDLPLSITRVFITSKGELRPDIKTCLCERCVVGGVYLAVVVIKPATMEEARLRPIPSEKYPVPMREC